jgi:hypothetical protein
MNKLINLFKLDPGLKNFQRIACHKARHSFADCFIQDVKTYVQALVMAKLLTL